MTWEPAPLKGTPPEPRSGHTFTVVGTKAYLFGGVGRKDGKACALGDLHALDLNNSELLSIFCSHLSKELEGNQKLNKLEKETFLSLWERHSSPNWIGYRVTVFFCSFLLC